MTQKHYRGKNSNGEYLKTYRQTLMEQNVWRCDCSAGDDERTPTDVNRHEIDCRYGVWYVLNDLHLDNNE